MASDVRVRYTKMFIKQSLTELLKTKPLKKITVKEICEKAEINRATFYKHYLDVYDLLDQIENQLIEELKQALKAVCTIIYHLQYHIPSILIIHQYQFYSCRT